MIACKYHFSFNTNPYIDRFFGYNIMLDAIGYLYECTMHSERA